MTVPDSVQKAGLKIPLLRTFIRAYKFEKRWSRPYPPGHFYSPLPSDDEIKRWGKSRPRSVEDSGLMENGEAQKNLVSSRASYYTAIPFQAKPADNLRYYGDNNTFGQADAIFLHLLIRHLQPRQIMEVGSGYSSAVMLDTVDHFRLNDLRLTFIEPYTDRLRGCCARKITDAARLLSSPCKVWTLTCSPPWKPVTCFLLIPPMSARSAVT
jgi:hypothetical protein